MPHQNTACRQVASRLPFGVMRGLIAEVATGMMAALIAQLTGSLPRGVGDCVRLIDSTTVALIGLSAGPPAAGPVQNLAQGTLLGI